MAVLQEQQASALSTTTDLQSNKDTHSFKERMNVQREKAKQDSYKFIDAAFDKTLALGANRRRFLRG